jgi:polyferredoxin
MFSVVESRVAPPLADLFFRLNPLSALGAMLASRVWIPRLGLALITVGVTLLVGRVWCGWICPLGSLLEWISFRKTQRRSAEISSGLRKIKYFSLALILGMAFLGNLTFLALDPLAILTRTTTTLFFPAFVYAVNSIERVMYTLHPLRPLVDWVESLLRGPVLPIKQPAFGQGVFIGVIFFIILGLNALAPQFWCRYLCPLGAFLGLLSRISLLRPVIGSTCTGCNRCTRTCQPGAIQPVDFQDDRYEVNVPSSPPTTILPSECTVCLDCLVNCKFGDIHFDYVLKPSPVQDFDLSRRETLGALAAGAAGLLFLRTDLRIRRRNPWLIRPPGVDNEEDFLSHCLRCSQCMEICPTTALQPALTEAGLEGLWTPIAVPRVGYCDYGCNACGQVCPSGAIPLLSLEEKRLAVIGKASVNRDRCLPWASNIPCIVCEEMCPTPTKSIRLEEVDIIDEGGTEIIIQRPYVLRELCIGCGICEEHCPLEGEAAIRVYAILS